MAHFSGEQGQNLSNIDLSNIDLSNKDVAKLNNKSVENIFKHNTFSAGSLFKTKIWAYNKVI